MGIHERPFMTEWLTSYLQINRTYLMSLIEGWERCEQEKVKGLHPAYCDKTGRAKHPWVRIGTLQVQMSKKEETQYQEELPF